MPSILSLTSLNDVEAILGGKAGNIANMTLCQLIGYTRYCG
jgi:hypothetical protein